MSHFSEDIMFQYTKTKVELAEFFSGAENLISGCFKRKLLISAKVNSLFHIVSI